MRPRAFADLANLPVPQFLEELATGMALLVEHINALSVGADAASTVDRGNRAAAIARGVADEEAGKYLILLDAARCAGKGEGPRSKQLRRCNDHVAKGLYAELVSMRPASLRELVNIAEHYRHQYYLDGPSGDDWIFRNEIEEVREGTMYVDYVATDDGSGWVSPRRGDAVGDLGRSPAVELIGALDRAGANTPAGLRIVETVWRNYEQDLTTHWSVPSELNHETLRLWSEAGLADRATGVDRTQIIEGWTYPMFDQAVSRIPVSTDDLRQEQQRWIGEL